jgi:preprotein translocase subunit SecE
MNKVTEYLKNVRSEMAKVSWPTRKEVTSATVLVVFLSITVSLFVFVCDKVLNLVLGFLL